MGDCYRYLGQPQQALRYYLEALDRAKESGGKHVLFNIYRKISTSYAESGDFATAYQYSLEFASIKDSVYNQEKAKAISELEVKYEKEKDQQKIALLERDKKIDENRKWLLTLWLILVAAVASLGIALLWQRNRKNRQLYAREKEVLAAREALTEAELRNTRNELSFNKTRLAVYMENLLRKNSLIEELEARLNEMSLEDEASNAERAQRLNELLELKILTDEDWLAFKQHFEQAFPGYLEKLQAAYVNMTTAEIRLFLLIRLGLGSREISNMLGVSPDSVKKGRYRLRKKLDLAEEDSLEDFVASFS
jgi:DNA-binding CsgD family transcriptional regulator